MHHTSPHMSVWWPFLFRHVNAFSFSSGVMRASTRMQFSEGPVLFSSLDGSWQGSAFHVHLGSDRMPADAQKKARVRGRGGPCCCCSLLSPPTRARCGSCCSLFTGLCMGLSQRTETQIGRNAIMHDARRQKNRTPASRNHLPKCKPQRIIMFVRSVGKHEMDCLSFLSKGESLPFGHALCKWAAYVRLSPLVRIVMPRLELLVSRSSRQSSPRHSTSERNPIRLYGASWGMVKSSACLIQSRPSLGNPASQKVIATSVIASLHRKSSQ